VAQVDTELHVEVRKDTGKGVARKLRAAGRMPGVVYGRELGPVAVSLDPKVLYKGITLGHAGMNTLFDLRVDGDGDAGGIGGKTAMVKELQRDPVSGVLLHADLYTVDVTRTIEVSVPVHLSGKAAGVEMGGILDHSLREVELECLPRAIPDEIVIDVSALEVGDSLHVRDLPLPEGVELRSDPDLSVVSVVSPAAEEAEAPEEEEAAAAAAEEGEAPPAEEGEESGEESGEEKGGGGE